MGNRAVIRQHGTSEGVYIHWNGGRDTVEPVLTYGKILGVNFSIPMLSLIFEYMGLNPKYDDVKHLDCNNYDNGVYVVDDWDIVDREYFNYEEQDYYNPFEVILWANDSMNNRIDKFELARKYEEITGKKIVITENLLSEYPEFMEWVA